MKITKTSDFTTEAATDRTEEVGRYSIKGGKRQQYFTAVRAGMDENRVSIVRQDIWSKPMNYSRILRVIGQTLEPLRPETYEVVCYGNCYLVRCRVKEDRQGKKEEEKKVRGLAAFLRLWREPENPRLGGNTNEGTSMNVEFLYSMEELNRQDEERKEPRRDPNAMPDPYSFSNTLRAVGEFLDRKPDAKLLFASNRGQEVVILYETKRGVRNLEEYPISTLYEFWVKEYVKRKK